MSFFYFIFQDVLQCIFMDQGTEETAITDLWTVRSGLTQDGKFVRSLSTQRNTT